MALMAAAAVNYERKANCLHRWRQIYFSF